MRAPGFNYTEVQGLQIDAEEGRRSSSVADVVENPKAGANFIPP